MSVSRQKFMSVILKFQFLHSKTGTLDRDSEKYRISEKNITKANNTDLEFSHRGTKSGKQRAAFENELSDYWSRW